MRENDIIVENETRELSRRKKFERKGSITVPCDQESYEFVNNPSPGFYAPKKQFSVPNQK